MKTGAVAPEVGRLEPGKLDVKEKQFSCQQETTVGGVDEQSGSPTEASNDGDLDGHDDREPEPCDSINGDTEAETDSGFKDDSDSLENKSDDGDFEIFQNCNKDNSEEANDDDKTTSEEIITDSRDVAECKNKGENDEDANKKRGIMSDNEDGLATPDYEDDSSDFTSDEEDNAVEFMPDGEIVRKKSRGFKQLNNCKRFWKASLMLDKGKQTNETLYSSTGSYIVLYFVKSLSLKYFFCNLIFKPVGLNPMTRTPHSSISSSDILCGF